MFSFLDMMGTYEARAVQRYEGKDCEGNDFVLDTCMVTDSVQPYETALEHKFYNENRWVILESYDTKEEAFNGHLKWLNIFTNKDKELPRTLINHSVGEFDFLGDDEVKLIRI